MNNKEKLTEATVQALQNKLTKNKQSLKENLDTELLKTMNFNELNIVLQKMIYRNATDVELNEFIETIADNEVISNDEYFKLLNKAQDTRKIESKDEDWDDDDHEEDEEKEETLEEIINRAYEEEISAINTYDTVLSKTDESTDAKLIEMINEIKKDEEDHKSLLKHYIETGEALTDDELEELKNSEKLNEDKNEDDSEDIEVERTIEIDDEDDSECPYLVGYSSTDLDIEDREDLTEDELFVTGWTGIVDNVEEGPFESFNEM